MATGISQKHLGDLKITIQNNPFKHPPLPLPAPSIQYSPLEVSYLGEHGEHM